MDSSSADSPTPPDKAHDVQASAVQPENSAPPKLSTSGITTWAKSLKIPPALSGSQDGSSPSANTGKSPFSRFTSGFGLRTSPKAAQSEDSPTGASSSTDQSGLFGTLTKGLVDSSKSAVKAVQIKARHAVSQNKRRYQEGEFDLDMTYITENIIAMGFPAGDMSSGFFGFVEGLYRNHMEEVIKFFETHHKDKYKVYNLCSERLYDASLFEGKVACFPFDDHNCPPIQLIISFCHSAYSWLKEDIENVVVVHCKAGMARTGLMISSLLLYLKFFPTAEESIDYYNQKRCFDGKGLVLPSQIRYVKYFERVLTYFNGENQPGRRCMLRGFRLHKCPYWIRPAITVSDHNGVLFSSKKHPRTKDLSPEDFWFSAPKKGIMVFALPGEPGLTGLSGDFKIHFHDRQGDFYCWLNTTMIENRKTLNTNELDGFDKMHCSATCVDCETFSVGRYKTESGEGVVAEECGSRFDETLVLDEKSGKERSNLRKLPSPGFQVEVVLVDHDAAAAVPSRPQTEPNVDKSVETSGTSPASTAEAAPAPAPTPSPAPVADKTPRKDTQTNEKDGEKDDDVFSDSETEETGQAKAASKSGRSGSTTTSSPVTDAKTDQVASLTGQTERVSLGNAGSTDKNTTSGPKNDSTDPVGEVSDFKMMAADASVFSFGDEDDYESD